jgi:FkbM family methyltransferase
MVRGLTACPLVVGNSAFLKASGGAVGFLSFMLPNHLWPGRTGVARQQPSSISKRGNREKATPMAKLAREIYKRLFLHSQENLVAFDDVYGTLCRLLAGASVTGILDAGASDARVTKKLLRCFPTATAYCFEPNVPQYGEAWKQLVKEDERLRIAHLALADEESELELHVAQGIGATSLYRPRARYLEMYPEDAPVERVDKVPVVRLDDWLAKNGNPAIQLMKFDIQAAELRAMKGAEKLIREHVLAIYTEIFFNPMYEGGAIYSEIDLFLRECGFSLYNLYKPRADQGGMLEQGNAIFVKADALGLA